MEKREIKFRAWDGTEMYTQFLVARPQAANVLNIMQNEDFAKTTYGLSEWKVMQYTGLKDKAGVEIYEGDIVEVDYTYRTTSKHTSPYVDKLVCRFTNGSFNFFYKGIERVLNVDTTVYSVIGNIHQNPELCSA